MAHGSYFEFGYKVDNLLFHGFSSTSVGGLFGLIFFTAALTLLYEATKIFRQRLTTCFSNNASVPGIIGNDPRSSESESPRSERTEKSFLMRLGPDNTLKSRVKFHLVQTFLYTFQTILAYFLMLIVMSYNLWLGLTVFVTSGLAYFVFGLSTLTAPMIVPREYLQPPDDHH